MRAIAACFQLHYTRKHRNWILDAAAQSANVLP